MGSGVSLQGRCGRVRWAGALLVTSGCHGRHSFLPCIFRGWWPLALRNQGWESEQGPSLSGFEDQKRSQASFGPRLWFLTAERKEMRRTVATAYVLLRLGKGGHCVRRWHRRVAHDAKAKENALNRRCKPQFNSTESG